MHPVEDDKKLTFSFFFRSHFSSSSFYLFYYDFCINCTLKKKVDFLSESIFRRWNIDLSYVSAASEKAFDRSLLQCQRFLCLLEIWQKSIFWKVGVRCSGDRTQLVLFVWKQVSVGFSKCILFSFSKKVPLVLANNVACNWFWLFVMFYFCAEMIMLWKGNEY